jgi:hypothetical protein
MRLAIAIAAAAATVCAAGAAAAGPSVEIRDAVARVTVIPEDRADVKVEFLTINRALPLEVRTNGGETIIDGGLRHRIHGCHTSGDNPTASVRGVGTIDYKDMPQVVIHAPKAVVVDAGGAVIGTIGRAASLDLENSGCSNWTVADVSGDAVLRDSGVGTVRMGAAGRLDVHLSGSGSVRATKVGGLDASVSGAGGITVGELTGPMQAQVSGVGHVKVLQGDAGAVRASISGVGGVDFGGRAASLDAQISGIGGIRVKEVTGHVTKSISGGGHISIG